VERARLRAVGDADLGGSHTRLRSTRAGVLAGTLRSGERGESRSWRSPPARRRARSFASRGAADWDVDDAGRSLLFAKGGAFHLRTLSRDGAPRVRQAGRYEGRPRVRFHPAGDRFVAYDDASGRIRLWAADPAARAPIRNWATSQVPGARLNLANERIFPFYVADLRLAAIGSTPREAADRPLGPGRARCRRARSFPTPFGGFSMTRAFAPDGRWLATANFHAVCYWPLPPSGPRVLLGHRDGVVDVEFTPDSGRLISADRTGRSAGLELTPAGAGRTLAQVHNWSTLAVDPAGVSSPLRSPAGCGSCRWVPTRRGRSTASVPPRR